VCWPLAASALLLAGCVSVDLYRQPPTPQTTSAVAADTLSYSLRDYDELRALPLPWRRYPQRLRPGWIDPPVANTPSAGSIGRWNLERGPDAPMGTACDGLCRTPAFSTIRPCSTNISSGSIRTEDMHRRGTRYEMHGALHAFGDIGNMGGF